MKVSQITLDNFLSHSGWMVSEANSYMVNCRKIQIVKNIPSYPRKFHIPADYEQLTK